MTLLQHHILALSLTALTTFSLGLIVWLAGPSARLNRAYGLYSLAVAWWAVCEAFLVGAQDPAAAQLWSLLEWPGVIFIPPTFLHLVALLTKQRGRAAWVMVRVAYGISAVFLLGHLFTDWLTEPPRPSGYARFHNDITALGAVIPLVFLAVVSLGLWTLWRAFRSATGQRRTQLTYLFWSSIVAYVGGSPDWLFVFDHHIPWLSPFGIYGVPCYSIATAYAVFHHRLFDVHLVIRKSLAYSLLVSVLTIGYFGLVYIIEHLFQTTLGYRSAWLSLAAFALMALVFQPMKIGIQRLVEWLFFRAHREPLVRRMERLEQEVRQAEKLKAISTLAAGMAHEIKNPLTSIKTFAEYLPEKGMDPAFQQKFQRIVTQEVAKIDQIVRRLLDFAKPAAPKFETAQASQLLDDTLDFLNSECLRRHITVERQHACEAPIQADPQQLRQAFLNLFLNSLDAMTPPPARVPGGPAPSGAVPPLAEAAGGGVNGHGGTLTVRTLKAGPLLQIIIHDTGPGIPKEHLTRLCDPFFTTKPDGTGLGLSIARSIIQEHRGQIRFSSQPGCGTTVTIELPL